MVAACMRSRQGRHIFHVFPGFDAGGAQMRTLQLMAMLPTPTRHTILAMNGAYGLAAQVSPGVEVATLGAPPRLSFLSMGRFFAGLLDQHRPDAVMTYNWGSIEMLIGARRRRFAPLIHHEDGFGPEESTHSPRSFCLTRTPMLPLRVYLDQRAGVPAGFFPTTGSQAFLIYS